MNSDVKTLILPFSPDMPPSEFKRDKCRASVKLFVVVIFLTVLNPFVKIIFNDYIPFLSKIVMLKDVLLFVFYLIIIIQEVKIKRTRVLKICSYLSFGCFSFLYIYTFISEGQIQAGLYYYRLNLILYLFAALAIPFFQKNSITESRFLLKSLIVLNIISNCITIVAYSIGVFNINAFFNFLGKDGIYSSLLISGANFLRASLPQDSANLLGLYLAPTIFLLLFLVYFKKRQQKYNKSIRILLVLDVIVLLLTFSRSSILALIIMFAVLLFFRPGKFLTKAIKGATLGIILMFVFFISVEALTGGKLIHWIELNTSFKDPSLVAHNKSIVDVFNNFDEYYLSGLRKGSVGPRAYLFGVPLANAENSIIDLLYEMGVFQFVLWACSFLFLFPSLVTNIYQAAIMAGFLINIQFLPNIFETGAIIYLVAINLLFSTKYILSFSSGKDNG